MNPWPNLRRAVLAYRRKPLLVLHLYSNQPKHLGDFAAIVQSGRADLTREESLLAIVHPEMLRTWKRRVVQVREPAPAPARPPPRRRK